MDEDRDKDKLIKLVPSPETGMQRRAVSVDVVKSAYIAEGLSEDDLAARYFLSKEAVAKIVEEHKLPELRKAYIIQGLAKIQSNQLTQAQKLLDIELDFKRLRIIQLERQLQDFLAYYSRHGDFCKRHPVSGEILKDTDGIPMQIHVPNVTREIAQLKESVTLSDGMKKLMAEIDSIINAKPKGQSIDPNDTLDMTEIDGIFRKKE